METRNAGSDFADGRGSARKFTISRFSIGDVRKEEKKKKKKKKNAERGPCLRTREGEQAEYVSRSLHFVKECRTVRRFCKSAPSGHARPAESRRRGRELGKVVEVSSISLQHWFDTAIKRQV